ncbi:MAG: hypothetical protein ACM3QZ_03690 [Solirubrobacterales bacterium]
MPKKEKAEKQMKQVKQEQQDNCQDRSQEVKQTIKSKNDSKR